MTAMHRSIQFNNAGVACFHEGRMHTAWVLFKGALEVRRSVERLRYVDESNDHIRRAEEVHRAHFVCFDGTSLDPQQLHIMACQNSIGAPSASVATAAETPRSSSKIPVLSVEDAVDAPYLYRRPMLLDDEGLGSSNAACSRSRSAAIIFNLALLDHLRCRSSPTAVRLYEMALSLLVGLPVDELSQALFNNIGVWCYENDDMDGAASCMYHLGSFLHGGGSSDHSHAIGSSVRLGVGAGLSREDRQGMLSNVLWLLMPPTGASPAA